ncbi:Ku protein [Candidatus Woesearchaeota archaeon]|nr:MAG: Ku protein [Candidatus Woesearchaeota archaeon]
MKAVWKGSISFGMVNIPIKLYTATEPQALGFRLLCTKCHTPLHYRRFCPKCKKEIEWEDVVKGLEIAKGKYYVLTKEKIEKLKPEKSDIIEIIEFVDMNQIHPIYFDKSYYVAPIQKKEKAYFLFKEVLQDTAKVAIGRFIMREKEYICAIESYINGLLLTTLNYAYEIRDIKKIEELKNPPKLKEEELKLARQLINKLYEKEFDVSEFKDTFAQQLKRLIKKGIKTELIEEIKATKKHKKEPTLMEALKASIKK